MAEENYSDIIETLKLNSPLRGATDAALSELTQNARRLQYDKGQYIFNEGDPSENVYIMDSGRVILSKISKSGKPFTFAVATRGIPLNVISSFKPRPRFFSAIAIEKTTVISIPSLVFKQWVLENTDVAAAILIAMGELLDGAYNRILELLGESAEQRVLNALSMLVSRFGPNLSLTNENIADITGATRETVARIISRLQTIGLLYKSRGNIKILNIPELDKLSNSPNYLI